MTLKILWDFILEVTVIYLAYFAGFAVLAPVVYALYRVPGVRKWVKRIIRNLSNP
jgi:hypothetical protein